MKRGRERKRRKKGEEERGRRKEEKEEEGGAAEMGHALTVSYPESQGWTAGSGH